MIMSSNSVIFMGWLAPQGLGHHGRFLGYKIYIYIGHGGFLGYKKNIYIYVYTHTRQKLNIKKEKEKEITTTTTIFVESLRKCFLSKKTISCFKNK